MRLNWPDHQMAIANLDTLFLDAEYRKVWGANRIRDPGSLTPSNDGYSILEYLAFFFIPGFELTR